jgi:hypothetical protein
LVGRRGLSKWRGARRRKRWENVLGIFVGYRGIAIVEGHDYLLAPECATGPHKGRGEFKLLALDGVIVDGLPRVCAFYEELVLPEWERGLRPIPEVTNGRNQKIQEDHP